MRNYYEDLNLTRSCSYDDIANSFRSLAYLPQDIHSINRLAEAYEVLSDPQKRKWYDQFGEYILKEGFTIANESICGYRYIGNYSEILVKFFGTEHYLIKSSEFSPTVSNAQLPPKDIIIDVPCTLEEIYAGCQKNVNFSKNSSETLWKTLEIPPGCESDHKFIFYGEGEESNSYSNSNLVFLIKEIPHKFYKREGKNLIYQAKISLLHALSGHPVRIVRNI